MICDRLKFSVFFLFALLMAIANENALAGFTTYSVESNWQTAAGTTLLEDFETYSEGTQISSLPSLGIGFESLAGGGFPNIYNAGGGTPYGPLHLGNFPNGINEINQWDDIVLYALPGYQITALGFWNGDGQNDTLIGTAYDDANNVLGSVGAFKGTFAGFTSDIAISRVVFDGNTGDGWNHLDGLQIAVVPEPVSSTLFIVGGATLGLRQWRKKRRNA
jgi:hypothetical protein